MSANHTQKYTQKPTEQHTHDEQSTSAEPHISRPTPVPSSGTRPHSLHSGVIKGVVALFGRWWDVVCHPTVATFDRHQAAASWLAVWLSVLLLALAEALGVGYAIFGPDAAAGYSSLPVGPKLHLPQTPLLPLAALLGSIAQFFLFTGLLQLSARLLGGRGAFKTQAYLIALFWVPLMLISDIIELLPTVGSVAGPLIRLYALYLCVLALASAQRFSLGRAWAALLLPVAFGLLLGLAAFLFVWPHLQGLIPIQ